MANKQQRFIVVAYPIDGHIRAVMNPIQWRQERRGLREVPGQRGPIEHVTIVLNTIDTMRCRHNRPEVFHQEFSVSAVPFTNLLHLFKGEGILGFHWSSRAEGVHQAADGSSLLKKMPIILIKHSLLSVFNTENNTFFISTSP